MINSGRSSSNIVVRMLKSYGGDLRGWLSSLGTRYALAAGLLAGGAVLLLVAAGVGVAAGFYAIELHYGAYVAYAVVGGSFLICGIAALLAGKMVLNRPAVSVPTPQRQLQTLKGSMMSAVGTQLSLGGRSTRPDPVTRMLAAGAAATLIGWVAVTWLQRRSGAERD